MFVNDDLPVQFVNDYLPVLSPHLTIEGRTDGMVFILKTFILIGAFKSDFPTTTLTGLLFFHLLVGLSGSLCKRWVCIRVLYYLVASSSLGST